MLSLSKHENSSLLRVEVRNGVYIQVQPGVPARQGANPAPFAVVDAFVPARRLFTLDPEASIVPAMERAGVGGDSAAGRGTCNRLGLFLRRGAPTGGVGDTDSI